MCEKIENYENCPSCNTENTERYWCQTKHEGKDTFVCAYCYNGNYNAKQVKRMRTYKTQPIKEN